MVFDKKAHWQNIYQDKPALEVSWYQQLPKLSLELINRSRLHKNDAIIDVGGGASVLVDYLLKEGYSAMSVLDISENALASAKKRLAADAGKVDWYEQDITEFKPSHPFSLWHDRAVFHFLTDKSDRAKYVKVLKQALKPGGHLIIAAFAVGGPQRCSGLDIVQYDEAKLMKELGKGFELREVSSETHITPTNQAQKFQYFWFIKN